MLEWLVHQDSQQFSFFRCSVCDSEVFLDHCRARLGCPTCSRTALYFLRRTKNGRGYHHLSVTLSFGVFPATCGASSSYPVTGKTR